MNKKLASMILTTFVTFMLVLGNFTNIPVAAADNEDAYQHVIDDYDSYVKDTYDDRYAGLRIFEVSNIDNTIDSEDDATDSEDDTIEIKNGDETASKELIYQVKFIPYTSGTYTVAVYIGEDQVCLDNDTIVKDNKVVKTVDATAGKIATVQFRVKNTSKSGIESYAEIATFPYRDYELKTNTIDYSYESSNSSNVAMAIVAACICAIIAIFVLNILVKDKKENKA